MWALERLKQIVQFLKAMLVFFSEDGGKRDPKKVLSLLSFFSELYDISFKRFLDMGVDGITISTFMQQIASLISLIVIALLKLEDFCREISQPFALPS